jgi:hypothetical protein
MKTARSILAALPPGISGAGGHPATFRAACECVRLGLGDADALALLGEYNQRCSPPWTDRELLHKLADARKAAGGQVRQFSRPAAPVRVVWKVAPRKPAVAIVEPAPPVAPTAPVPAPPAVADAPETPTPLAPSISLAAAYPDPAAAPHLAGWRRDGAPVFIGTQRIWRDGIHAACQQRERNR